MLGRAARARGRSWRPMGSWTSALCASALCVLCFRCVLVSARLDPRDASTPAPARGRRRGGRRSRRSARRLDTARTDRARSVVYLEIGAARRVRAGRAGTRGDGPAQRDVRAARPRHHHRHRRRFPEQRSHLPQRVLALERRAVRPGTLRGRPLEIGPVRSARHRAGVLRHPLAHERVHPRLQPSVLRDDRHRRPLPHRQRAAGHLQRGRLERGRVLGAAARHRAGRRRRPSSTSRVR